MTRRDRLLKEIVSVVPSGAEWFISTDSVKEIPLIMRGFITSASIYNWVLVINDDSRDSIIELVSKQKLADKIVHSYIAYGDKKLALFYDHMDSCYLDLNFSDLANIQVKYKSLSIGDISIL